MANYSFKLGKNGNAEFEITNDSLVLSVNNGEVSHSLTFNDFIKLDRHFNDASAYANEICIRTFNDTTSAQVSGNEILFTTEIKKGIKAFNRFTVLEDVPRILLEIFFETEGKVYDCAPVMATTQLDMDGFELLGGGGTDAFFPIEMKEPNYGFDGHLILKGENKYLKITGGNVSILRDKFYAFTYSLLYYNDDLAFFGKENPLRVSYTFEETDAPIVFPDRQRKFDAESDGEIVSGKLKVDYKLKKDGAAFVFDGIERPISVMCLRNIKTRESVYVDTLSGWESASFDGEKFTFVNPEGLKDISLIITAEKKEEISRIEWSVEVKNDSADYSFIWCNYPRLYYSSKEKCNMFTPRYGGALHKNVNAQPCFTPGGYYPSGFSGTMPYFAIYPTEGGTNGKYFAVHDSEGSFKEFYVSGDSDGFIKFYCKFIAENYVKAGNGQKLPGKAVWQELDGDWYDATLIYREFVETCSWYPKAGEQGRTNIPEWMRDIPFWVMDWVPNETDAEEPIPVNLRPEIEDYNENSWFETPIKLQEAFGVPIGYHLYNWHGIPFNNDYPHYLPAKKALPKGLAELRKHDIRIMPYINALLWDNKDKGGEDFRFTKDAFPGAVKNEFGKQHILRYASHEPDGKLCELSPMCPSAKVWRDELKNLIDRMYKEYDFDAIYLDQIAARVPHLCMDESHGHPLGGGGWWQKNYRELLKEIHTVLPEGKGFTSEANAEVYANDLEGFLSWAWVATTCYVPAFMTVYGGKVTVLGRNANGYLKNSLPCWKYHLAQALCDGTQLGWINSDLVYNETRLNFAKNLVRYRYDNREFYRGARTIRPPFVDAPEERKFSAGLGLGAQGVLHESYLIAGILENGKKRKMIIVNVGEQEYTEKITFRSDENGLKSDNFTFFGDGKIEFTGKDSAEVTVAAGNLIALDWEV